MNVIFIKLVILLLILSINVCHSGKKSDKKWKQYLKEYHKHYGDEEEEQTRRKIWEKNMKEMKKHNEDYKHGVYKYTIGINNMSDWTNEEIDAHVVCYIDPASNEGHKSEAVDEWDYECDERCKRKLPKHVDWRKKHVITRVKNQGKCGSCWAFGTVAGLEAHNALETGKLIELSEQELVDCSSDYGTQGCNGGFPWEALDYAIANRGLNTEKDYPYKGKKRHCKSNRYRNKAPVLSYINLRSGDEELMKAVVAHHGPVIAGIYAPMDLTKFVHFRHGVFHSEEYCVSYTSNHAVLIVGYGVHKGTPYWLVKNSWGKEWGRKGYIMMIRNANSQCAIASFAVLPILV